ncbi:hypothetical protein VNO77_20402 [Canavalia gladiata]|uniref:Phorbol-ester/DAG-type domain-containing protein n=1 Tax=Canavalia gladiata TaxID=3824 RepID=A0AAN9LPI2_CANGL
MAPRKKITIEHFTHQGHPLTYFATNTQFLCDGCKKLGNGNRYRCSTCDFDLHEHCATCPTTLASFMHPMHQLTLVLRKPQGARHHERVCNVCGTFVNGLFYRCKVCDFDVHPLCIQLPQHTRHPLHPHHVLRLQPLPGPSSSGWCMVCKTTSCNSWSYRCEICNVEIHLKCFNSAPATPVCGNSGSCPVSRSSSVSGFARAFYKTFRNFSSGQGSDGGVNGEATNGNDVYATIAHWATSTWLNGFLLDSLPYGLITNSLMSLDAINSEFGNKSLQPPSIEFSNSTVVAPLKLTKLPSSASSSPLKAWHYVEHAYP